MTRRPNIVYFHSHDTGRFVAPYGYAVDSPNYQRLAQQACTFRHAFAAAPTCSPSRAALLTGQWPHVSGMLGLAHRGFSLADDRKHLAHLLADAGYETVLAGFQHVGDPARHGYTSIRESHDSHAEQVAARAVDFLRRKHDKPFFLDAGCFETHREFPAAGPGDDPRYLRPPEPMPDTPRTREDFARYQASLRRLDRALGAILDELDEQQLADDTIILCTTDHGLAFPDMKCNLTVHGCGVLMIMRAPGVEALQGGKVSDALISQVDIMPTLCDLIGIDHPDWLQGKSMTPLFQQQTQQINEQVFGEVTYHAAYEPMRSVRTTRHVYIKRFGDRRLVTRPNCDDGPSRHEWLDAGWADHLHPDEALYDVIFDPQERVNLVGQPEYQHALDDLRARLDAWMRQTDDPLLQGDPLVAGAQVNDPAQHKATDPTITL